jgi:hypothetical protein
MQRLVAEYLALSCQFFTHTVAPCVGLAARPNPISKSLRQQDEKQLSYLLVVATPLAAWSVTDATASGETKTAWKTPWLSVWCSIVSFS